MAHPFSKGPTSAATRPNTVGLTQEGLNEFLDSVDTANSKGKTVKRVFVRWPFRRMSVDVTLMQPGGNAAKLKMACRNISCGGMSLLHNSFVHTGTRVTVKLSTPSGDIIESEGTIVRCQHVRGMVHEIGVKFLQQIVVRDIVQSSPFNNTFSLERVDPESLRGTIVYADDSAAERKLVTHYLRGTALRLRTVDNGIEGLTITGEGCDLVIVDLDMPGMSGAEMIQGIREAGYSTPVIVVTADTAAINRINAQELKISAFLAKPYTQDTLLRAIAEFISADSGSKQSCSTLAEDHPNRGLVAGYVLQVMESAKKLSEKLKREDLEGCRTICMQLKGSAANFGFETLGHIASVAFKQLAATKSVSESGMQLRTLITACERTRRD
ncbi:MAG: response regulator [Planctomycetota bacterium]